MLWTPYKGISRMQQTRRETGCRTRNCIRT
ncbi:hypothetical protein WIC_01675, partial [Escherichia coli KTE112]